MRVLHQNKKTGEIKVYLEGLDDLWHLKNIVIPGDLVWADTQRRKEEKADKIRAERAEKKRMRLGVRVEKVEFQDFQDKIRIHGRIEDGPQDIGQYHTLLLGSGDNLSIFKEEWKKHELDRIMSAVKEASRPSIYFVSLDDNEASIYATTQYSIKELGNVISSGTGKMYESKDKQSDYYEEILNIISASMDKEPLVILGPGFAKERLLALIKERDPTLAKRSSTIASGQTGAAGVYEVMKKGLGSKILDETRIVIETKFIDEVLMRISKGEPVAYGPDEVARAANSGAIELLFLTENQVRSAVGEQMMKTTENLGGKVEILSTSHDAGKQLESLGGYAALLRYPLE